MATRFEARCAEGRMVYAARFVPPTGQAFIDAYNKGWQYRIKVERADPNGEVYSRWGFVGLTTGWEPAFILMRSTRARGSCDVLDPKHDLVVDSHWMKERTK